MNEFIQCLAGRRTKTKKAGHLPDLYNAWPDAGQRPKTQDMSGEIRTSSNPTLEAERIVLACTNGSVIHYK